jgi:hypothetical protein
MFPLTVLSFYGSYPNNVAWIEEFLNLSSVFLNISLAELGYNPI